MPISIACNRLRVIHAHTQGLRRIRRFRIFAAWHGDTVEHGTGMAETGCCFALKCLIL